MPPNSLAIATQSTPRRAAVRVLLALGLQLSGCRGIIDDGGGLPASDASEAGSGAAERATSVAAAGGATSAPGAAGSTAPGQAAPSAVASVESLPGVPLHRLNNTEYDNTVHDLLGVTQNLGRTFIADEKASGFDNNASALRMTDAQFEQYWNAADSLATEVFATPALRDRILVCQGQDDTCARQIINQFGRRALRRPLVDSEVTRLMQLRRDAQALGEDFNGSLAQVVRAVLSSVDFLYRIEPGKAAAGSGAAASAGYELASRLSYLLWSSMPDDALLTAAEHGELENPQALLAQVDRMLKSPRSRQFVESFAGQWLGLRDLRSHQVEPSALPKFDEPLRGAMLTEGFAYFDEFLSKRRALDEFFTADVNYVDAKLAALYGMAAPGGGMTPARVTDTGDKRRGFLGLSSFLTLTSFSYRTAPTLRGKWVLENLLCQEIPPPPANVPVLDKAGSDQAALQSQNVRARLQAHRENPSCAGCHTILDPIGLGLEHFDAIGAYREKYANGESIDASGELPDGTRFSGLSELTEALADDARFHDCVIEKLMTYALSRELVADDEPHLKKLREQFEASDRSVRALLELIVTSTAFRAIGGKQ